MRVPRLVGKLGPMTTGRGPLIALHLCLVWAVMTAGMTTLGFASVYAAMAGGTAATVPVLAVGLPVALGLLALTGLPVAEVVPLCGSASRRLSWTVLVFLLGTPGVFAGLVAYTQHVDLGSAGTRVTLTGMPYAVAAAFFVPSRWVRLGAPAPLIGAAAYVVLAGPAAGS